MDNDLIAGRYRLDTLLGRGAMSEVWRADDLELERSVALKLLAPDADRARFDREARAAAALAHPHITQLYDYGEAGGRPYMVLEYLSGGTLEDRLEPGKPLADEDAERIAAELASGLAHAHARGLVHRDLKPANILFDGEGRAKIADFGIARLGEGGTLTEAGTVLGTAAYISPEQAAGRTASPASDVYSFGVMLFRMLTGRLPFEAEQPLELVALHRDEEPPPLERFRSAPPAALAALTAAALAKDPAARPADGTALAAATGPVGTASFAAAGTDLPSIAPGDATQVMGPAPPGAPRRRRLPAAALAAVAAVLLGGGIAVAYAVAGFGSGDGQAVTSSTLPTAPTRTLPKLKTTATAPVTPVAASTSTSTAATTTAAAITTQPRATTAQTTTAAPLPATTEVPAPTTTDVQPGTTEPAPTITAPVATTAP